MPTPHYLYHLHEREAPLTPENALRCYAEGLFVMELSPQSGEHGWFRHVPRGILPFDNFHIPRSLRKIIKKKPFELHIDRAFHDVVSGCIDAPRAGGWISPQIQELFTALYHLNHAHSVECWQDGLLVGGLYGLHIGGVFFGESMFSKAPNASKIAFVHLVQHLKTRGFSLLDMQQLNDHTAQFGGVEIAEDDFLLQLYTARNDPVLFA